MNNEAAKSGLEYCMALAALKCDINSIVMFWNKDSILK